MPRFSLAIAVTLLAATALVASSTGGCSRAADRTLTIQQFQTKKTYDGQFQIDTSQLPDGAIKDRTDRGRSGDPVTVLTIDPDYEIRVVLVPVNREDVED